MNESANNSVVGYNMFDESALFEDSHDIDLPETDATLESNDEEVRAHGVTYQNSIHVHLNDTDCCEGNGITKR